ncbi:MAG: transcriptional repressor [Gammaproteobacteria bacterium]|nr:MAG: transcriptional repressor [Gammaproteobacteria bacterium]
MWQRHQHSQCIKEALSNAEQICIDHKCRLTPIRKKVLELIWKSHKPIKAYDLLAQLSSEDFIEKPPTVYRALDFLIENNLIHRIESQNAYIGCNTDHGTLDSKFLICDQCNEVEELSEPKINKTLSEISKKQGFIPSLVNVEIHGTCSHCARE